MTTPVIYNCHTHLFTQDNVPNGFLGPFVVPLLRVKPFRAVIDALLNRADPRKRGDKYERLASFIRAAYREKQEGNLKALIGYYPEGSRFVVLPMDFKNMGMGRVKEDIDEQHAELARLARNPKYSSRIIPFAHIDPNRKRAVERLRRLVEGDGFRGVKIYPSLGYRPDHPVLMSEVYPYLIERDLPVIAHCSRGWVYTHKRINGKKLDEETALRLAHPDHYASVLRAFPDLRICLAHFGGSNEWERHLCEPKDPARPTWLTRIRELIASGEFPNLYTDIAHTIYRFQENAALLALLLDDPVIREKVLFGSDFYAAERMAYSEKRLSIDLRFALGEEKFWKIAYDNPRKFLGLTD